MPVNKREADHPVSLGIGLTNACNLNCAHCYRDQDHISNLTLTDVQRVCESLPIGSIAFGTGENGLNPDYFKILEYLHRRHIKMTLASNGHTLSITPDEQLVYFEDVEFSVDFPDQTRQDRFRGAGNWKRVMQGIERCLGLGIRVSILAVLMNLNYRDLGRLARTAASFDSDFRVNVYQPVYTDEFLPDFEQYWEGFKILFDHSEILSVTEPLVSTFLGFRGLRGTPCGGRSLRIAPDRKLKACVYWPESDLDIDDLVQQKEAVFRMPLFSQTHQIPSFCRKCDYVGTCRGGCAARRKLQRRFGAPDTYCPVYRRKEIRLSGRMSAAAKPLRSGSICTTIVRGD